jgi:hypothetical protein
MSIFRSTRLRKFLIVRFALIMLLVPMAVLPAASQTKHPKPTTSEPTPEPAIPAILAAFDRFEVVAMPEAHGMKDVDDFILALLRDPSFPGKVNDIEVECGNSLYQPLLDRYIAGMDVPFAEVRKVWRNPLSRCAVNLASLSSSFLSFAPSIRNCPQPTGCACWLATPRLTGKRSRLPMKPGNLAIADLVSFP